jgi:DNA-binding MarR family transcriptional regulator
MNEVSEKVESSEMLKAKCVLKLAETSKICDDLISKELMVLIALINERGLRVSDIHFLLGGNKSWVSNLCSRLATAGLTIFKRDGREVYYKLTEKGAEVALKTLELVNSLLKTAQFKYLISENTLLLDKTVLIGKKIYEFGKLFYPYHSHAGSLVFNYTFRDIFFIGYDRKGKPFVLDIPMNQIRNVELDFDDVYKRRYSPRIKPLIVDYSPSESPDALYRIYLFTGYHVIGRLTQNTKWLSILTGIPAEDHEKEEPPSAELKKDIVAPVEIKGYEESQ